MPIYKCTYKTSEKGKQVNKMVVSKTRNECLMHLSYQNIINPKIREVADLHGMEYLIFGDVAAVKVNNKILADFFDQLSFLLKAGMQLYKALESLGKSGDKPTKGLCAKIMPAIAEGHSLDDALAKTNMFKPEIIYQIKAGAESGDLVNSLDRVSETLRKQNELRSKTITAAIYPAFMLVVLIAVTAIMMTSIVPQIAASFEDLGGELPEITLFVIAASDACVKYAPTVVGLIAIIVLLGRFILRRSMDIKEVFDKFVINLPLFGELKLKTELASLCNVLNALMVCGIPMVQSIGICINTIKSEYIKRKMIKVKHHVEVDGIGFYNSLKQVKGFPDLFTQLIDVGEKSGDLTPVLEKLAKRYEKNVEEVTKRITALLEPLVIVLMVIIGGTVVIGMMMPIFTIVEIV